VALRATCEGLIVLMLTCRATSALARFPRTMAPIQPLVDATALQCTARACQGMGQLRDLLFGLARERHCGRLPPRDRWRVVPACRLSVSARRSPAASCTRNLRHGTPSADLRATVWPVDERFTRPGIPGKKRDREQAFCELGRDNLFSTCSSGCQKSPGNCHKSPLKENRKFP
jgi:hypothetical protein